jgi:hypothetical protein
MEGKAQQPDEGGRLLERLAEAIVCVSQEKESRDEGPQPADRLIRSTAPQFCTHCRTFRSPTAKPSVSLSARY